MTGGPNLSRGEGAARVREHMRSQAVGGVFTGRSEDIGAACGVPWKSVEKIVAGMIAAREVQRIRPGSLHRAAQYWVEATPYARPEPVAAIPRSVSKPTPVKPPTGKKGHAPTVSEEVLAELERMTIKTTLSWVDIAAEIRKRFVVPMTSNQAEHHARRRGWTRDAMTRTAKTKVAVWERGSLKSVRRDGSGRTEDNPVRLVPPGTFATNGFTMMGGRSR